MDYKLSVKAKNDLEEIWIYTFKNWSIEQADRYIHQLIDEINYVSKNPNIGKDFGSIRKGYRRVKVVSHLIFYKVSTNTNTIDIIRILHQQMDIENRLNEK